MRWTGAPTTSFCRHSIPKANWCCTVGSYSVQNDEILNSYSCIVCCIHFVALSSCSVHLSLAMLTAPVTTLSTSCFLAVRPDLRWIHVRRVLSLSSSCLMGGLVELFRTYLTERLRLQGCYTMFAELVRGTSRVQLICYRRSMRMNQM